MAIAKINKIELIGLKEDQDQIFSLLQKLGIVELIAIKDTAGIIQPEISCVDKQVNLLELQEALSYLAGFRKKSGLLKTLVKIKPLIYAQQLKEVVANFDYRHRLEELQALRQQLKHLDQHKERLIQERQHLFPWRRLDIPLDRIQPTRDCGILTGILNKKDYLKVLEAAEVKNLNLFVEAVNQDQANIYLLIFYLKGDFEPLEAILKNHHFNFATLSRHNLVVRDRLFEINRQDLIIEDQIQDLKAQISLLASDEFKLMVIHDYLNNFKQRQAAGKNLAYQQLTFYLAGWIKQKDVRLLEETFAEKLQDIQVFISSPPDEPPPVDLQNNRLIEPFEFITKIYGLPKYNEIDPTPFLAPFFLLYFGFCVSDAGYGLLLILFCSLALKKLRLGPLGLRFFRLFLFCGISTVIFGLLTGSWFGNLVELISQNNRFFLGLKKFKDSLVVLDPLKEPTRLLGIALFLGIIQVWFGNIVAGIGNIKNKRYLAVLLDQVTMLTLLFGLTGLGLSFLKLLPRINTQIFKFASLAGAVGVVLTQGRAEKGWPAKLFFGLYNLYTSLSGYLSDILSYSRLWALGLVTSVMANTINLISIQFSQIFTSLIPFIHKIGIIQALLSGIILITIFILGHLLSFLMNLLGAFVHPLRLQFVEFFSKFFKGGGVGFRPFKLESKYVNLEWSPPD